MTPCCSADDEDSSDVKFVLNEEEWPRDFGRDVLEGLLEHPDAGIPLARRKKLADDEARKRVMALTKRFEPYDWTRQL